MSKILVVDDVEDNVTLLRLNLEDDNYQVVTADNGLTAIDIARSELPDLILLDVMMPGISGIETCKRLKSIDEVSHIPVIMISAKDQQDDIIAGLDVGAQDYIAKPINYEIASARIRSALRIKKYEDSMRALNLELEQAKFEAQSALKARTSFFSTMSHEIRTPITAIMGYAEIMSGNADREIAEIDQRQVSEMIFSNSKYLLDVISTILDFSKLESNKMGFEQINSSVFEIVEGVENVVRLNAIAKKLNFSVEIQYPIPEFIKTDPLRVKQVLINICGNAIKFTDSGSVNLRVSFDEESKNLSFSVRDTGIGMNEEELSQLFVAFAQANPTISRRFGGTGLGLNISKEIVERLGGELKVNSAPNVGSTFSFEIPSGVESSVSLLQESPVSSKATDEVDSLSLRGRVLVVEDESVNLKLISFVLEKLGIEVLTATDGEAAVECALNDPIDVILMDMHLPKMNGVEATRLLREKGCTIPVVALTASQDQEEINDFLAAGCQEYVPKPFQRRQLHACMKKYLTRSVEPLFTKSDLADEFESNEAYAEIILNYMEKLHLRVRRIEDCINKSDWLALRLEAHNLIAAELFGFNQISLTARLLEDQAKKKNSSACSELLKRLNHEVCGIKGEDSAEAVAT
jgi:DNA-binding response OmpR family regulator/anti-sigma regulatory factor (Ser/Thr protein kinase)